MTWLKYLWTTLSLLLSIYPDPIRQSHDGEHFAFYSTDQVAISWQLQQPKNGT